AAGPGPRPAPPARARPGAAAADGADRIWAGGDRTPPPRRDRPRNPGQPDPLRVPAAAASGRTSGRGLRPPPDHGGALADRVRRRRARLRRPHLEPPTEGRARPPETRARRHGQGCRLQIRQSRSLSDTVPVCLASVALRPATVPEFSPFTSRLRVE